MTTKLPRIPPEWSINKIKGQLARAKQYAASEAGWVKEFYERLVKEYETEIKRREGLLGKVTT